MTALFQTLSFYFPSCGTLPPPVIMVQNVSFRYNETKVGGLFMHSVLFSHSSYEPLSLFHLTLPTPPSPFFSFHSFIPHSLFCLFFSLCLFGLTGWLFLLYRRLSPQKLVVNFEDKLFSILEVVCCRIVLCCRC